MTGNKKFQNILINLLVLIYEMITRSYWIITILIYLYSTRLVFSFSIITLKAIDTTGSYRIYLYWFSFKKKYVYHLYSQLKKLKLR